MDTAKIAMHPVATVETHLHSREEPDEERIDGGTSVEVGCQWPRAMVELRWVSYESSVSKKIFC